jgi:hypothetical protein
MYELEELISNPHSHSLISCGAVVTRSLGATSGVGLLLGALLQTEIILSAMLAQC